jgi:hypothetical protein
MAKFIRCGSKNVAKLTKNRWALEKGKSTMDALAVHIGNYKDRLVSFKDDKDDDSLIEVDHGSQGLEDKKETPTTRGRGAGHGGTNTGSTRTATKNPGDDHQEKVETLDLLMAAKDVVANLVNTKANKEPEEQEEDWAFNAVKLASSKSKDEAATSVSTELQYIMNRPEKKHKIR